MAAERTLLAHLAWKLGDHPENIMVEALGHVLSSSAATLHALEDVLQSGGARIGPIHEMRTQASDQGGTHPDLAGFDENGEESVLIEAKLWAGLTENQPVAYLNRLRTEVPSALIFVVPAARIDTLWVELSRRVVEAGIEMGDEARATNLRSVPIDGQRHLMVTGWGSLLDRMSTKANLAGDTGAETDIRQLLGLARRMDEEAFLPLRPDDFGPHFARRVLNLRSVIHSVTELACKAGWASTKTGRGTALKAGGNTNGYGQNIRLGLTENAYAWLGYHFDFWAAYRDTPMWLEISSWEKDRLRSGEVRRRLQPLLEEDPPGLIDTGESLLVPIYLPTGVEKDAVVGDVLGRLEYVTGLIDRNM